MKADAALHQAAVGCGDICKLERRLEKKQSSSYQWGRTSLESQILLLWSVNQANSQTGSQCTPTKLLQAAYIQRRRGGFPLKMQNSRHTFTRQNQIWIRRCHWTILQTGRRSSSALGREAHERRRNVNIGPSSSMCAINQRRHQLTGENEAMGTLFFKGPQPIPLWIGFPVTEEQASYQWADNGFSEGLPITNWLAFSPPAPKSRKVIKERC